MANKAWKATGPRTEFSPMFPTPTAGDGRVRPNNARPGSEQPTARPNFRRKVRCRQCGFLADLSKHSNDGGSLSGDGAGGAVTAHDSDSKAGVQSYRKGAGCPLCFSRNFAGQRP